MLDNELTDSGLGDLAKLAAKSHVVSRLVNLMSSMGKMIICPSMNVNLWFVGGVSLLRMFTTTRPHGYINRITWLGISQFF